MTYFGKIVTERKRFIDPATGGAIISADTVKTLIKKLVEYVVTGWTMNVLLQLILSGDKLCIIMYMVNYYDP